MVFLLKNVGAPEPYPRFQCQTVLPTYLLAYGIQELRIWFPKRCLVKVLDLVLLGVADVGCLGYHYSRKIACRSGTHAKRDDALHVQRCCMSGHAVADSTTTSARN